MEEWDIQYKELLSMPEQSYRLIDIRDEASMSYGMIPGAEWLPTETIEQNLDAADKEKKLVLYCTRGALSEECAEVLREKGYDAVSLEGGYTRWLLERMEAEQKKEEEESGEELCGQKRLRKVSAKNFTKDCSRDLPRRFGNMSWCRRGTGLQSVFPVEKIRC